MSRRRKRGQVAASVIERTSVAYTMGQAMFHPAMEPNEACDLLAKGQSAHLSTAERDAFDGLMPATFRNAFASGWNRARLQALGA